jgi:hypothetical protein
MLRAFYDVNHVTLVSEHGHWNKEQE